MHLYRPCDVVKTFKENFFGKLLILAPPREKHITHRFIFLVDQT